MDIDKQTQKYTWKGILWWSSGWDSHLSLPKAQVQSLVGELRVHQLQGTANFFFFSRVWKTKGIRITKTPFKEKNQFGRRGLADSKTYHMGPPWRSSG